MIEINLLPAKHRPRSHSSQKREPMLAPVPKVFPLALGALALVMGLLIVLSGTRIGANQRKSKRVERQLREAKIQAAQAEQVTEDFPVMAERYMVLASRLNGKIGWLDILRVVNLRCPEGVLITSLKLEHDRRTGQPSKFLIRGLYSEGHSLEMRLANGLKESATFSEIFEAVIPEKNFMPDGRTSFAISCLFRPFEDELVNGTDEAPSP